MSRLRALFVADRTDAPYRYRCVHAVRQLRAAGAIANVVSVGEPGLTAKLGRYSVVVLFRLRWGPAAEAIVSAARRAGVALVFDCDDLVFDPKAASLMPFRRSYSSEAWEESYGKELLALRRTFDACDSFVGSTPALVEWAARSGKPARCHPNVVPDEYPELAARMPRRARSGQTSTIGYFAGSNTHDLDFARVAPALRKLLRSSPSTRLLLGGFVDVHTSLSGLENRIVRLPFVSYRALPWALAACDVTIAPISELNAFTHGKSALKFFEPGTFGVPVVASPIASMQSAIEHGVSGWLAESEDAWVAALAAALAPATGRAVGEAARRAVERSHTSRAVAGRLATLLGELAGRAAGKEPDLLPLRDHEYDGRSGLLSRTAAPARRALEVARIRSTLRRPVATAPTPADARALVERILAGAAPAQVAVLFAGSPQGSDWGAPSQIEADPSPLGESRLTGTDPHFVSPPLELPPGRFRFAVLHMRAFAEGGRGHAQLFWQASRWRGFREGDSTSISLAADGTDATYVVDLMQSDGADFWQRERRRVRFRFDPLDRPGTARALALALVPDGFQLGAGGSPPRATPLVLPRRSRSARTRLVQGLSELSVGESLWVDRPLDPTRLRRWLGRRLAGSGCSLERLEPSAAGARALIHRTHPPRRWGVDIVVPVFNARALTLRCLRSVLRHARGDFRLVVIDDASTDPELWPALGRLAEGDTRVVLLRNDENLGFVKSANRGFAHAGGRDVLLLNSDTRVFRGFLQGIQACVQADDRAGIVCPLSNNATICSVPEFCRSNALPDGMSARQMAALVRKSSARVRPELVTPVGFCMYVREEILSQVGHFDECFGRGFGEENDLGERAREAGWHIRLADDVYVWHEGAASFGDEGSKLSATNSTLLEARHPGYHAAVAHFIEHNPLREIHDELRLHLGRSRHAATPSVMLLLHASPFEEPCGGTEYVVRDLVQKLRLPRAIVTYPGSHGIEVAEVLDGDWDGAGRFRFPLEEPVPRVCHEHDEACRVLTKLLAVFRVGHVHVHHLMGWPLSLERVLRRAGVPYSVTLHDFYALCPSQNLLDPTTARPCCPESRGDPDKTRACMLGLFAQLAERTPDDVVGFVEQHRLLSGRWLAGARRVFFPSQSTRSIVEAAHPSTTGPRAVLPHAYVPCGTHAATRVPERHDRLRVALIGEVAYPSKGAHGYLEVMRRLRGAPIEWHIFGRTDRFDFERRLADLGADMRVVRHGSYARDDIVGLLRSASIDVGLLLPIWPETFSLTLSELLAAGVPVVAAKLGALRERLEGAPHAFLVDSPERAAETLGALAAERPAFATLRARAPRLEPPDLTGWLAAHRSAYAEQARLVGGSSLPRRGYRLLSAARVFAVSTSAPTAIPIEPAARHRAARWYQSAERLKPYLPESIRALARRSLSDQRLRTLQSFRIPSRRARAGNDVRLEARYLSTARYSSLGSEACFFIDIDPIAPADVHAIRFDVWCSNHGYTYAQLYWRHEGDAGFSEAKSLTVELKGSLGDWQAYSVRLDEKLHPSFFAGDRLIALRFDPVNYAGLFGVGGLALCARAD